jgi:hypothetical protein
MSVCNVKIVSARLHSEQAHTMKLDGNVRLPDDAQVSQKDHWETVHGKIAYNGCCKQLVLARYLVVQKVLGASSDVARS